MSAPQDKFTDPRSIATVARILAALVVKPMTTKEMTATLHMSKSNAVRYIRFLRTAPTRIRIVDYQPGGGRAAPIYGCGNEPDAPHPGQASPKLKYARARKAVTKDSETFDRHLAKRRSYERIVKIRKTPQSWLSALGVHSC